MDKRERDAWFVAAVLPLEAGLMQFLRRRWRGASDLEDLRQEIYARVYDAAKNGPPLLVGPFVFRTARNLLIDKARRAKVVSLDFVAEMEAVETSIDMDGAERHMTARRELRALEIALKTLPPRCRQVVMYRKIEGLSQREVARRMGITEDTVERQVSKGVRALAQALYAEDEGSDKQEPREKSRSGRRHEQRS